MSSYYNPHHAESNVWKFLPEESVRVTIIVCHGVFTGYVLQSSLLILVNSSSGYSWQTHPITNEDDDVLKENLIIDDYIKFSHLGNVSVWLKIESFLEFIFSMLFPIVCILFHQNLFSSRLMNRNKGLNVEKCINIAPDDPKILDDECEDPGYMIQEQEQLISTTALTIASS